MKVLELFGGVIRRGGEEMFVYNVLTHYSDPGTVFDCLVIEDCENDDFRHWIESQGGQMHELNIPLHATRFSNHIYKPVLRFLKENRFDVIHIHSSSIAALAVLASAAHRAGCKKVIVHSHSVGRCDNLEHRVFRTLAGLSMRSHADVYCACSHAAAQWKFAPKYAAKAIIVKNGIDTDRFAYDPAKRRAIRDALQIPADAFVIGNVGRLCELKNQAFLLEVFALIAAKYPDAYLVLIGDGEDSDRLRRIAEDNALSSRVRFTGNITNVPNYMSAMDVFAFPSAYEGLGIVAIEAQCAGLPVVASAGVPREVELTDRVTFIEVAKTAASYTEWAERLCACRGLNRADGAAAVRAAGYDIRSTVEQVREIYGC